MFWCKGVGAGSKEGGAGGKGEDRAGGTMETISELSEHQWDRMGRLVGHQQQMPGQIRHALPSS